MDKKVNEARKKAIEALEKSISFWGVDPLETQVFATLFLSHRPLNHNELAKELGADDEELHNMIRTLEGLGAVRAIECDRPGCACYEAESDFFQILQTVLKERRDREMGKALKVISEQRKLIEDEFEDEGTPELEFLADRMAKLDNAIKIIDKTMYGLGALASLRGLFKGK